MWYTSDQDVGGLYTNGSGYGAFLFLSFFFFFFFNPSKEKESNRQTPPFFSPNLLDLVIFSSPHCAGLLGEIRQQYEGIPYNYTPSFVKQSSQSYMQDQIETGKNYGLQQAVATGIYPPRCDTCPRSGEITVFHCF